MPFITDRGLAIRLERTLADDVRLFAAAVGRLRPGRAESRALAGGWANVTGADYFGNRVQGAGLGGPVASAELEAAERLYAAHGLPAELEVCPLAHPSLVQHAAERGYRLVGFRNVYAHPLGHGRGLDDPAPAPAADVTVVEVGPAELPTWSETLIDGFGYRSEGDRTRITWWNHMLFELPQATLFLACLDGEAVGAANLIVHGHTASLGGTATRPEHRRRGVQRALLAARLAHAGSAGCTLAVLTADPGGGSARNGERAGFGLAYTNVRLRCP